MAKRILFRDGKMVFRGGKLVFVEEGQAGDCECCEGDPCTCEGVVDWSTKKVVADFRYYDVFSEGGDLQTKCSTVTPGPNKTNDNIDVPSWVRGDLAFAAIDTDSNGDKFVRFSGIAYRTTFYNPNPHPACSGSADFLLELQEADLDDVSLEVRWDCTNQRWQYRIDGGTWRTIADGSFTSITNGDTNVPICEDDNRLPLDVCLGGSATEYIFSTSSFFNPENPTEGFSVALEQCYVSFVSVEDAI